MPEFLTQEEIDSLLQAAQQEALGVDQRMRQDVVSYDFRRPNRISKNQLRSIQNLHETFAETLSYYFVSKLQTVATVNVTSVDQLFYSEYILSVTNPNCLYVFDIEGADGAGVLEISPPLALTLIERLLGGTAEQPRKPRSITPIEQAVLRGVVEHILADLSGAWRSVTDCTFRYNRFESEPDFVQIAPASEIVLVVSFDVSVGLNAFVMNICYPTFALEEVIARLNTETLANRYVGRRREQESAPILQQHLSVIELPLVAELGRATITVRELLELDVGDVLKLDTPITGELVVSLDGKPRFAARPGKVEDKKAIRITRVLGVEDILIHGQ
ncbi:Flagellar motor switch protein FliM [bacterium HR20]|jgi:flagellar motor switch protein FliM|uniref:Flagellar motor switch protein FliM n=1 Tax=uncultured Bacteroidota bacterium TaxID=152509 RepID=H5SIN2_9BACT|nr:flagellar motor switch protein FliM [uncultured Bacteroidetes bacterium]GBD04890.1 Flagellar motor switch protein FliM [bacterium HR20]